MGLRPAHPDPAPVLQSCFDRVLPDVPDSPFKFAFVSDEVVVILPLPEGAFEVEQLVAPVRTKRLPGLDNRCERMTRKETNNNVYVVWHDTPGEKAITLIVKMGQRAGHFVSNGRISQVTRSCSRIEVLFYRPG